MLVKSDNAVVSGGTYTLKLEDGQAGKLRIDSFTAEESEKFRAMFVGEGSLR
jgi:hypothetical protein